MSGRYEKGGKIRYYISQDRQVVEKLCREM